MAAPGKGQYGENIVNKFDELIAFTIVLDGLHDRFGSDGVLVKFKPERLKGIIFGVKTSQADKRKIEKLVNEKYNKNSKSVEFYQATYIPEGNSIEATVHFSLFRI